MSPGTGAIVAALEYATGKTARSVGKPDPQMFETALDRLGSGRTLVIGDRLDADLAGAAASGLDGAIVLTGVATRAEAQAASDPGAGRDRGRADLVIASSPSCSDAQLMTVPDRQPGRRRRPRRRAAAGRANAL